MKIKKNLRQTKIYFLDDVDALMNYLLLQNFQELFALFN